MNGIDQEKNEIIKEQQAQILQLRQLLLQTKSLNFELQQTVLRLNSDNERLQRELKKANIYTLPTPTSNTPVNISEGIITTFVNN